MAYVPTCYWQMSGIGFGIWKSSTHIHTYNVRTYIRAKMVFERSVWVKLHEYADCNGTQYVALGQVGNQTDYWSDTACYVYSVKSTQLSLFCCHTLGTFQLFCLLVSNCLIVAITWKLSFCDCAMCIHRLFLHQINCSWSWNSFNTCDPTCGAAFYLMWILIWLLVNLVGSDEWFRQKILDTWFWWRCQGLVCWGRMASPLGGMSVMVFPSGSFARLGILGWVSRWSKMRIA